jgi:GABA permease
MSHILVVANETAASDTLLHVVEAEAGSDDRVTVIAPVNEPNGGLVVYDDTRRAAAGRRLEQTLKAFREAGITAQGFVVETGPVQAAKDAIAQLQPKIDEIVVSTHAVEKSGWMRRNVVEDIERSSGLPVKHVVVEQRAGGETNVLVIANQTILSEELLDKIRERAKQGPASFLLVAPESDDETPGGPQQRLARALTELRGEGIEAHGQVVHPDPYTAAQNVVHDERVDEIIVSTFPGERSGWLRRDLVERLRKDTGLPVEHVVSG